MLDKKEIKQKSEKMKKIIKIIKVAAVCTLAICVLSINTVFAAAKTSSAQFLLLGAGARNVAMGQSGVVGSQSSSDMYWNPATLTQVETKQATLMHASWLADTSYEWASYAQPLKGGSIGLAVQYLNYGSIKSYDTTGLATGELNPNAMAVSVGYAKNINTKLAVGASAKYISSKLNNSATAMAIDAGLVYAILPDKAKVGLSVANLGTKLKYLEDEENLPQNIKLGGNYNITKNLNTILDFNMPTYADAYFGIGAEYMIVAIANTQLAFRAGYNSQNTNTKGTTNLSAGFGISYKNYSFDYAFLPYGDIGNANLISFSVKF